MKNDRGFTLIELLIVLGILALLSLLAYISLANIMEKGRDAKRVSDVNAIQSAVEFVKKSTGDYRAVCGEVGETGKALYTCTGADDAIKNFLPGIGQLRDPGVAAVHCGITCGAVCDYALTSVATDSYRILFYLENGFEGHGVGCYAADEHGINKVN